ncbi:hypothetical protein VTL71DRAFT_836 [Oculimacula yallundae]|uniref:HIRAN domain-containing protein n=1 Tax=Oculimacula yallundae TaxID=86028 RepID=A0ABR4D2M5_9HELO
MSSPTNTSESTTIAAMSSSTAVPAAPVPAAAIPAAPVVVGRLNTSLVGLMHGAGAAANGAAIELVREPNNPFDSNAIKGSAGTALVGHLSGNVAGALSPFLDNGSLVIVSARAGTVTNGGHLQGIVIVLGVGARGNTVASLRSQLLANHSLRARFT